MADLTVEGGRRSASYEKITIDNTSGGVGFTSAKILGTGTVWEPNRACKEVFCTLEIASDSIRFTLDGTAPTTTNGHMLVTGDILTIKNAWDIKNFRAIRTAAADGTLHVTYKF